ncbi:MAG: c-type cytochrome [Ottowia sp.]|nr:c-type cytochrome [Ottowia sp.]
MHFVFLSWLVFATNVFAQVAHNPLTPTDITKAKNLASKYACLSCHAAERKLVGPAYRDIAAKYKAERDAAQKLAAKIRSGGGGVWGNLPMPANPNISPADLKIIVTWVLSGAPNK